MCGICGVFRHAEDEPIAPDGLEAMKRMLHHRGPDQEGSYTEPFVGLGHRRLSIIGVSDGIQPLSNETKTVWISFNGEIYNYRPLRERLIQRGHRFATATDTEVIVHLYEEEGDAFVHSIDGMFAIAIWDKTQKKLILVRDRLGKKPLYYKLDARQILFASELKAILAYPGIVRTANRLALHHYLSFGYVPSPLTAFDGIDSLPAGHMLIIRETGRPSLRSYWDLQFEARPRPVEVMEEEFKAGFDEAVKRRLESEVPLGVFLSGGADSSAVASRMARHSAGRLVSTTIAFAEPRYDESAYAASVARLLGTDHRVKEVGPTSTDVIEQIVWHFDEPFGDASAIPTFFLCKTARESITVALSGDGGDEMFAGYNRYAQFAAEERLRNRLHPLLRRAIGPLAALWPRRARGRSFLENLTLEPDDAACNSFFHFSDAEKAQLYSRAFRKYLSEVFRSGNIYNHHFGACHTPDLLSRLQYVDYKSYLVDDILVKVDRMSMASSLEVRSPLLDSKLIELVATFPGDVKLRGGVKKWLFKRMLENELPRDLLHRPKQGFGPPLSAWFRGELHGFIEGVLLDGRLARRAYFEPEQVERLWRSHTRGLRFTTDLSSRVWILAMLELWHRMYIDSSDFLKRGHAPPEKERRPALAGAGRA